MSGFQTKVQTDLQSSDYVETEKLVTVAFSLLPEVAWQLAQFCKRSTFSQFYDLTEAHLDKEERERRAYQMIAGLEALQAALAKVGVEPR